MSENPMPAAGKFQIAELDCNFKVPAPETGAISFLSLPHPALELTGLYWFDRERRFRRMPTLPPGVLPKNVDKLADCPAGAKIRFRTDSGKVHIKVKRAPFTPADTMNYVARAGFDLYVGAPGEEAFQRVSRSEPAQEEFVAMLFDDRAQPNAPGTMRTFTIYFPLYHPVLEFALGLDPGSRLEPPEPLTDPARPIVVYGTSITQGACASRPGLIWTSRLSRKLRRNVLNFGFSDGGKCEPEVGEILASIADPALYIIDCEANLGDSYAEKLRTFLPILLRAHPQTPILVMSRYRMTYWKLAPVNVRNQRAVVKTLTDAGGRIGFLDCSDLLGPDYAECLTDGLHANDTAFARIADALEKQVRTILSAK